MDFIGQHTAISHLTELPFGDIPILAENGGALPPLAIAVGDARRVIGAAAALRLEPAVFLHRAAAERGGLSARGRVHMLLGLFRHAGRAVPLLVVETQMGMPATEIIVREVLAHCRRSYRAGAEALELDAIYMVRAGTAGGINAPGRPPVAVGDLAAADFSLGWSGTLLQTMGGLDLGAPPTAARFREAWRESGLEFTADGRYPVVPSWPPLVTAIAAAAEERGRVCHRGGNLSKDSLYAEADVEQLVALRRRYDVVSTEMEQLVIAATAARLSREGTPVRTAMVSAIVGLIPGEPFARAHDAGDGLAPIEAATLETAALALWRTARDAPPPTGRQASRVFT